MNGNGSEKMVLLFEASVTTANRRAYDGVYRYAEAARWNVRSIEYSLAADKRRHGQGAQTLAIPELLDLWRPDGAIIECGGRLPQLPLARFGTLPVVFMDCHPSLLPGAPITVYTDAASVARVAVRELLPRGLASFAYLPFTEDTIWSRQRGDAFVNLVKANGFDVRRLSLPRGMTGIVQLTKCLVPQLRRLVRPCGLFACNDGMGRLALTACEQAGLDVPNDVAVVGVDNDEALCENAAISLTSVRVDFDRFGFAAAQLLDARMADRRKRPASVAVESTDVVRRASSRRLPNADARVVKAIEYIRRNACLGISPPDVVREMACSRRLADLRFAEAMGHTILDEIHAVRLARVQELLLKPNVCVSAIPDLCGYGSLSDLCRDFKKRTGQTLRAWSLEHADDGICEHGLLKR